MTVHIVSTRPSVDIFSSITVLTEKDVKAKKTVITNATEIK